MKRKIIQAKIWDKALETRKEVLNKPHKDVVKLSKDLKKRKINKILDLGCGYCRNALYLAKEGFEVYGIDFSRKGLKLCKQEAKKMNLNIHLKCQDIYQKLPYKNNFFDAIISIDTIHHNTKGKIIHLINEITRVLKDKGLVYITIAKNRKTQKIARHFKKIEERTYVPLEGEEKGIPHFLLNKSLLKKFFKGYKIILIGSKSGKYGEHYFLYAQKT